MRGAQPTLLGQGVSPSGIPIIYTDQNTRVPCICKVRTADIFYNDIKIGTISEEANDAGETDWVLKIDWENWERSGTPPIMGINTDLRLTEYIRRYVPAFVEHRTLPDTRDRLLEELARYGMTENDRFEYMCRTHGICGCDTLTVERQMEADTI